jgi:uncharacterized membrane protein
MSSKSAVKILAPATGGGLFRWTAILTGSKNAVKGSGFLLGAVLLAVFGFVPSVLTMAAVLFVILIGVVIGMPKGLPVGRKNAKFSEVFSKNRNINWLSAARLFLFGARDVWFVVGLPIYFYAVLSDGTTESNHMAFFMIGTFMAVWTILYGIAQGSAPRMLKVACRSDTEIMALAKRWVGLLIIVPAFLAGLVWLVPEPSNVLTATIVLGLLVFGGTFAVNSALHSFLILSLTDAKRVTMDVGFYYMANSVGRLVGTVLSGFTYQMGGLSLCLGTAAVMVGLGWLGTSQLKAQKNYKVAA